MAAMAKARRTDQTRRLGAEGRGGCRLSVPTSRLLLVEVHKAVGGDRFSGLPHQMLVVVQVVQRQQDGAKHLVGFEKMAKIRSAQVSVRARQASLKRLRITLVAQVSQFQLALIRERGGIATISSRHYAIEHVDASPNTLQQILRRADSHQVARPIFRQQRARMVQRCVHFGRRFPNAEPSNGVTRKIEIDQALSRFFAEIFIQTALNDAKLDLR